MKFSLARISLTAAALALGASTAFASAPAPKGSLDWEAHMKNGVCYNVSFPTSSSGAPSGRGRTYLTVSHQPGNEIYNSVALVSGFSSVNDATVQIEIDGSKHYKLLPFGRDAFIESGDPERSLIIDMVRGKTMDVVWKSARGREIRDTYSLMGFTATYNVINEECGVR